MKFCTSGEITPCNSALWGQLAGKSFVQKDLENVVQNKLSRSQNDKAGQGRSWAVIRTAASKWREVMLPQYSSVSSAELLSTMEKWSSWRGPREGLQSGLRDCSTFHRKTDWETWGCLAWRRVRGGPAGGQSLQHTPGIKYWHQY